MAPYISEMLFNEPQGRPLALLQFGVSLTFLCMFVYTWSVGDAGDSRWLLFLVVGTALSGIAESLPKNRRQAAGVLRFAGILVLVILVAAPFIGFNFIRPG
mgnify:CR=1 FL=1